MLRVDATAVYVVGMKLLLRASSYCCTLLQETTAILCLNLVYVAGLICWNGSYCTAGTCDCCSWWLLRLVLQIGIVVVLSYSSKFWFWGNTLQGRKRHQPEKQWPHLWTIIFVTTFLHLLQLFITHTCNSKYLAGIMFCFLSDDWLLLFWILKYILPINLLKLKLKEVLI